MEEKYLRKSVFFVIGVYIGKFIIEDDLCKVVNICYFGKCCYFFGYDIIEGFREGLGMLKIFEIFVELF